MDEMRIKEVINFMDKFKSVLVDYEKLTSSNGELTQKNISLTSVKEVLIQEIKELVAKKEEEARTISDKLVKCDEEIDQRKANVERSLQNELSRVAEKEKTLDVQAKSQAQADIDLRRRESLAAEGERKNKETEGRQAHIEVSLSNRQKEIDAVKQQVSSMLMEAKRQNEKASDLTKELESNKAWLEDTEKGFKKIQDDFNKEKEEVRKQKEFNRQSEVKISEEKKFIQGEWKKLTDREKELGIQEVTQAKRKKDNDDKEAALKAMAAQNKG